MQKLALFLMYDHLVQPLIEPFRYNDKIKEICEGTFSNDDRQQTN